MNQMKSLITQKYSCLTYYPKIIFFLGLMLLITRSTSTHAQINYYSQRLDNSTGLSNSCLNVIYEDSDNLIWLGTWDGLNVFDGSSFHVFNYSQGNPIKSIGSNVIYEIKEDKEKNIWIATIEGVSKYSKTTGNYKHYFYNRNSKNKVIDEALAMFEDDPQLMSYITALAANALPYYINSFEPDGQSEEGLMYWSYGLMYTTIALESMQRVLGTTYALDEAPGFKKTGWFPLYVSGPVTSLSIGDDPLKNKRSTTFFGSQSAIRIKP
jgi:ligand-binding sensor domain-containing protein